MTLYQVDGGLFTLEEIEQRIKEYKAHLERVKTIMENRYVATFTEVIGPCIDMDRTNKLRKELGTDENSHV
jgi:hypothetical protein